MASKIYLNTNKIAIDPKLHNDWYRIMEYNSPSGASVAVNAIKNGKTQIYCDWSDSVVFAFTARTFGEKSRLYAYCISAEGDKPFQMPVKKPVAKINKVSYKTGVYYKNVY